jgi:hypothetical protein
MHSDVIIYHIYDDMNNLAAAPSEAHCWILVVFISYLNLCNFICRLGASPSDLRSFDIDNHIAV